MKLSLVVPCYNEEGNIKKFLSEVEKNFKNWPFAYEIIFIDDGSKDNTMNELRTIIKTSNQNIKVICFSRNFGKEAGIYAGLKEAKGEYVSIIDADLQQDPKYVLKMINILETKDEYDTVVAYQKIRKEGRFISKIKSWFYKIINSMSETEFTENASDFRTLRRYVVDSVLELKEYYRFSKGIFSWVGFNNYYMPYIVNDRYTGNTTWSLRSLFKYAISGIVSFSTVPLKMATFTGLFLSIFTFLYLIIVVIQKLFLGVDIPGYATIVVLILLLGGIELLCLGIIGEYLARTYVETKKRPVYITREIISNEKEDKND